MLMFGLGNWICERLRIFFPFLRMHIIYVYEYSLFLRRTVHIFTTRAVTLNNYNYYDYI